MTPNINKLIEEKVRAEEQAIRDYAATQEEAIRQAIKAERERRKENLSKPTQEDKP